MSSNSFARMAGTFVFGLLFVAFIYVVVIEPLWQQSKGGPLVMRTYPVNADYAEEVRAALQGAMVTDEGSKEMVGRVTLAPNGQLIVTAPKSMLGHTLGAAGGIESAVLALTIARGVIPPTINQEAPDPACNVNVVRNAARQARVSVGLKNSFGFGGTNASLVLRAYA